MAYTDKKMMGFFSSVCGKVGIVLKIRNLGSFKFMQSRDVHPHLRTNHNLSTPYTCTDLGVVVRIRPAVRYDRLYWEEHPHFAA